MHADLVCFLFYVPKYQRVCFHVTSFKRVCIDTIICRLGKRNGMGEVIENKNIHMRQSLFYFKNMKFYIHDIN